jgi:hypothetical protein
VNRSSVVAFVMAGVAALLSLLAYANYIYILGFPDGFITDLGYAQRRLAYIFIVVSVALALSFIYMGTVALRKSVNRPLAVGVGLYSLLIAVLLLIDSYDRSSLTDGGGG